MPLPAALGVILMRTEAANRRRQIVTGNLVGQRPRRRRRAGRLMFGRTSGGLARLGRPTA